MAKGPNVLFIVSDQHNAKVLGHAGHPNVKTPHLDRLAREGVRFTNAYAQSPICTPSRVSFLSGQYCHNTGYYGLSGPRPAGLPSVLGHFRKAGYATSAVGKIHCPEYWVEDDCDEFHETFDGLVGGRSAAYKKFLADRNKLHLEDHLSLTEFGPRGMQSMEGRPSPLLFEESQEGWIAAQTIDFMKRCVAADRPFFAFASLPRPHQCTAPSEPFWSMYEGEELWLPPNADGPWVHKPPHLEATARHWRTGQWALIEPRTFEAARMRKLRGYLGAVSQVDHAVGLMVDHLRSAGLAEQTIVVYTTDHGDYACEHGLMEKAPGIGHDAISRVPLLWWAPGRFKAGHAAPELAELVDVSTTLTEQAGLAPMQTSDGRSLSPILAGESREIRRAAVTEFAWSKAIRRGRHRYVHYARGYFPKEYPDGFAELYDLEADPWEMTNLAFEPGMSATVESMRRELLDWLIATARPATVHGVSNGAHWGDPQMINRGGTHVNADGKINPNRLSGATFKHYL